MVQSQENVLRVYYLHTGKDICINVCWTEISNTEWGLAMST